jgi:hypothetical protein
MEKAETEQLSRLIAPAMISLQRFAANGKVLPILLEMFEL